MRFHLQLLALLALGPPDWARAQQQFHATTADLVAWNFSGFLAIPPARQAQLVRVLADLDAEVVAAVEVNPDNVLQEVAARLTDLGTCYNALILDQTAIQNIGVIFKCEAQVSNPRLVPDSDDGNSGLRKAFAVDVRLGQFDFLLVVLHLKAGRTSADRATRNRQVPHIASFIASETAGTEQDVLVVGDYNMIPGTDASNFNRLNPDQFLRFVSSQDLAGQFSHLSTGSGCNDGSLLDGFAVSRDHTAEYIEASLQIYPIHRALGMSLCEFHDDVSDHLPLIARFRIHADDDTGGGESPRGTVVGSPRSEPAGQVLRVLRQRDRVPAGWGCRISAGGDPCRPDAAGVWSSSDPDRGGDVPQPLHPAGFARRWESRPCRAPPDPWTRARLGRVSACRRA